MECSIICYYDIESKLDTNVSFDEISYSNNRVIKLYNDPKLTKLIGAVSCQNTKCFVSNISKMDNNFIFYHMDGGFSSSYITHINNVPGSILEPSRETVFNIYSGNGDFLNVQGIVKIITNKTNIRTVKILTYKNKIDAKSRKHKPCKFGLKN